MVQPGGGCRATRRVAEARDHPRRRGVQPRLSDHVGVTPDGQLQENHEDSTETTQLSEEDLQALNALVDGAELRPGLRDGFDCPGLLGVTEQVRLTLSSTTLAQDATECFYVAGHVIQKLGAILRE